MRKIFTSVLIIASFLGLMTSDAGSATPGPTGGALLSAWSCETTSEVPLFTTGSAANASPIALPNPLPEQDTMERIGLWLHGTARPSGANEVPFYDYYLGYDAANKRSVYIEIDPLEGKYFVGTSATRFDIRHFSSLNRSTWTIDYPSSQGAYSFDETRTQFTIGFTNLTQVCTREAFVPAAAEPGVSLTCTTQTTGDLPSGGASNTVTITRMRSHQPWWQGVGRDSSGNVIYEYNIFTIRGEWIAVAVNATTGAYFIATSYKAPNVGDTTWTVVYPALEDGFSFAHVAFSGSTPTAFQLVFADGIQSCR